MKLPRLDAETARALQQEEECEWGQYAEMLEAQMLAIRIITHPNCADYETSLEAYIQTVGGLTSTEQSLIIMNVLALRDRMEEIRREQEQALGAELDVALACVRLPQIAARLADVRERTRLSNIRRRRS